MKIQKQFFILLAVVVLMMVGPGCDVGVNPLLFDGTPAQAVFYVNTSGTSYSGSKDVNLNDIFDAIGDQIDSVKVFNITIQVDSTGSTPSGTTISGSGKVDGNNLVTMTSVDIATLAGEQSIFDTGFTGFTLGAAGVDALVSAVGTAFADRTVDHFVNFSVSGTSSGSPLQMKIIVRVYTQVYTSTN
jgi:hypothetical protein